MRRTWLTLICFGALSILLAACGGDDDGDTAATTTEATTTTAAPTTTAPTTTAAPTTTEAPTTTTAPTTTAAPTTTEPEPTDARSTELLSLGDGSITPPTELVSSLPKRDLSGEALAESLLFKLDDFATGWSQEARDPEPPNVFRDISGCDLRADLTDNDGHLVEVSSPSFNGAVGSNATVEQDVRLYPSPLHAFNIIDAWSNEDVFTCTLEGAKLQAQRSLDNGEMGSVTNVELDLNRELTGDGDDFVLIRFDATSDLTTPDQTITAYVTFFFIQDDEAITRLEFVSLGDPFPDTDEFLSAVGQKFAAQGF